MAFFLAALALQPLRIEDARPVSRHLKPGLWTAVVVTIHAEEPFEGDLVASTDARAEFRRALSLSTAGRFRRSLPVYFLDRPILKVRLERNGRIAASHTAELVNLNPVPAFEIVQVASVGSNIPEGSRIEADRVVHTSHFDFSHLEGWEEICLEGVDVLVDPPADKVNPGIWNALGGAPSADRAGSKPFLPMGSMAKWLPADPREYPVSLRELAVQAVLLWGLVVAAMLSFSAARRLRTPVHLGLTFSLSLVGLVVVRFLFPETAALATVQEVRVILAPQPAILRWIQLHATGEGKADVILKGLVKPVEDVVATIRYDPWKRETVLEDLTLHPEAPRLFLGWGVGDSAFEWRAERGEGWLELHNGSEALARVVAYDGRRYSVPAQVAAVQTVRMELERTASPFTPFENILRYCAARGGPCLIAAVQEPAQLSLSPPARGIGLLEWRRLPVHWVQMLR